MQVSKIELDDANHFLFSTDGYWFKSTMNNSKANFEIFRFSNPIRFIEGTTS
jgi:hypothetical protein